MIRLPLAGASCPQAPETSYNFVDLGEVIVSIASFGRSRFKSFLPILILEPFQLNTVGMIEMIEMLILSSSLFLGSNDLKAQC